MSWLWVSRKPPLHNWIWTAEYEQHKNAAYWPWLVSKKRNIATLLMHFSKLGTNATSLHYYVEWKMTRSQLRGCSGTPSPPLRTPLSSMILYLPLSYLTTRSWTWYTKWCIHPIYCHLYSGITLLLPLQFIPTTLVIKSFISLTPTPSLVNVR